MFFASKKRVEDVECHVGLLAHYVSSDSKAIDDLREQLAELQAEVEELKKLSQSKSE